MSELTERPMVLIVDDGPQVQQAIRWALEDEGVQVVTAADGQQALDRRPGDGWAKNKMPYFFARLRNERGRAHSPVVHVLPVSAAWYTPGNLIRC